MYHMEYDCFFSQDTSLRPVFLNEVYQERFSHYTAHNCIQFIYNISFWLKQDTKHLLMQYPHLQIPGIELTDIIGTNEYKIHRIIYLLDSY